MVMWSHSRTFMAVRTCTQIVYDCYFSPCKLIWAGLDLIPDSNPALSPIICHHVGCYSLTCGMQMVVLCNTASTGNCSLWKTIVTTWQFHCHETRSLKFPKTVFRVLTKMSFFYSCTQQSAQQQSCQDWMKCFNGRKQIHFSIYNLSLNSSNTGETVNHPVKTQWPRGTFTCHAWCIYCAPSLNHH